MWTSFLPPLPKRSSLEKMWGWRPWAATQNVCVNSQSVGNMIKQWIGDMAHTFNQWIGGKFVFLDSTAFLDGSLDGIVQDLKSSGHDFPLVKKSGLVKNEKQLELLCQKGVYPYQLLQDDFDTFMLQTTFPPKSDFYNQLSERHITDEEYRRAVETYEAFNCQNMADYLMVLN